MKAHDSFQRRCWYCNENYIVKAGTQKYCSVKCRTLHYKLICNDTPVAIMCCHCHKPFIIQQSTQKYCSDKCRNIGQRTERFKKAYGNVSTLAMKAYDVRKELTKLRKEISYAEKTTPY